MKWACLAACVFMLGCATFVSSLGSSWGLVLMDGAIAALWAFNAGCHVGADRA